MKTMLCGCENMYSPLLKATGLGLTLSLMEASLTLLAIQHLLVLITENNVTQIQQLDQVHIADISVNREILLICLSVRSLFQAYKNNINSLNFKFKCLNADFPLVVIHK